jgi:hypothetical protein
MRSMVRGAVTLVMSAIGFGACAYPLESTPETTGGQQQPKATEIPWPKEVVESPDGSVRLFRSRMSQEEESYWKERYLQTELIPIPVPAEHQASVFRIRNTGSLENAALVGPRIFAYRSADGARLAHRRNSDGNVTLFFPVVLADGLTPDIQAPNGAGMIRLPDELLVQKPEELRRFLGLTLGGNMRLGSLPGCPKRIVVRVGNTEYDVTPSDLASGDHCPMNVPFTAAVTLSEGDARFLLESALYTGAVELRATYETRVPFKVGQMALEIDKARLLRELERALDADGGFWLEVDLRSKVARVLRERVARLSYDGDLTAQIDRLVERVSTSLFAPMSPEARTSRPECVRSTCVMLSYERAQELETVSVSWESSTSALTGQHYLTWTKLQPVQDRTVVIGETGDRWNCSDRGYAGGSPCKPSLRNDGSSIETGLTVLPGDLIEITPLFLTQEERALEVPRTHRQSNMVCTRYHRGSYLDCEGSRGRCRTVHFDHGCVETQDQWVETVTYEMDTPRMTRFERPVGQIQEIYAGLFLKFSFRREGVEQTEECALNSFIQEGDGQALRIRLEDRPGCRVFERAGQENSVMLHLKNNIQFPVAYKAGSIVTRWDGSRSDSLSTQTYYPTVLFGGTVAIRGYSIGSGAMGGSKAP